MNHKQLLPNSIISGVYFDRMGRKVTVDYHQSMPDLLRGDNNYLYGPIDHPTQYQIFTYKESEHDLVAYQSQFESESYSGD